MCQRRSSCPNSERFPTYHYSQRAASLPPPTPPTSPLAVLRQTTEITSFPPVAYSFSQSVPIYTPFPSLRSPGQLPPRPLELALTTGEDFAQLRTPFPWSPLSYDPPIVRFPGVARRAFDDFAQTIPIFSPPASSPASPPAIIACDLATAACSTSDYESQIDIPHVDHAQPPGLPTVEHPASPRQPDQREGQRGQKSTSLSHGSSSSLAASRADEDRQRTDVRLQTSGDDAPRQRGRGRKRYSNVRRRSWLFKFGYGPGE